jgi:hypothetical protein
MKQRSTVQTSELSSVNIIITSSLDVAAQQVLPVCVWPALVLVFIETFLFGGFSCKKKKKKKCPLFHDTYTEVGFKK